MAKNPVCAERLLFQFSTQEGRQVTFHVRFDVVEEGLYFFIGFLVLRVMAGILSLKHNSVSMVISNTYYRVHLFYEALIYS